MKKIFIYAGNACERRKLDVRRISNYLSINGYEIITNPRKADIIIVSTCGADNFLAEESFKNINRFKKFDAELIVAGCIPETDKERLKKTFDGKTVVTNDLDKIDTYFPENKIKFNEIEDCNLPLISIDESKPSDVFKKLFISSVPTKKLYAGILNHSMKNIFGEHHLALGNLLDIPLDDFYLLRISWACSQNCSYCAIKRALGKFHSKHIDQIINEFKNGLDKGFTNFFITADDTGAYGVDFGRTFPELLDKITEIKGDYNIGIHALNPRWLVKYIDEIEEILKRGKIKCLNMPIQSGNSRVLKLMNRFYDIDKIRDAYIGVKKAYPDLSTLTHCIVGFPTEKEEEFKNTLEFIKETEIDVGYLIPMSIRPNTRAESIEPKIPMEEITRRIEYGKKYLRHLGYKTYSKGGLLVFGGKR